VEFYSKNKFEKLVRLVGFIIRIYQAARSPENQIPILCLCSVCAPRSPPYSVRHKPITGLHDYTSCSITWDVIETRDGETLNPYRHFLLSHYDGCRMSRAERMDIT